MSEASRSDSWRAPYWRPEWARYSYAFKSGELRELRYGPWRCELCGQPGRLELHHVRSVRLGGAMYPNDLRLLQVLCRRCHIREEQRARSRRRPESDRPAWAKAVEALRDNP